MEPSSTKIISESDLNLFSRFWIYQKERFPILVYAIMVLSFTFSAAAYSRICRQTEGFVDTAKFITGVITAFGFFLLLRVFDEFKDAEDDARYRNYRPVPRGLITLREIGWLGFFVIAIQLCINAIVMPQMLWAYFLALLYIGLMTKEFFVAKWLKAHPITYMLSHMLIMPLIDFYTTGLDWINAHASPSNGLIFFLILTFFNGIVIEIGRKIRAPDAEEEGVDTYSALYGHKFATIAWLFLLVLTCFMAYLAAHFAGYGTISIIVLICFVFVCGMPAIIFLRTVDQNWAKKIETAAGIWTIGMYLTLGGVPMLINFIK
jgi:4-hydroxybenzoate polyprenyltransferase